jgi:hypothetical protein
VIDLPVDAATICEVELRFERKHAAISTDFDAIPDSPVQVNRRS